METYKFGGSSLLRITGTIIGVLADFIKWLAMFSITRFNRLSRWLTGVSANMLLNSQEHELEILRIDFTDRFTKRFKFKCDGLEYFCYDQQEEFKNLYVEYKNKVVEHNEIDYIYIHHNKEWFELN